MDDEPRPSPDQGADGGIRPGPPGSPTAGGEAQEPLHRDLVGENHRTDLSSRTPIRDLEQYEDIAEYEPIESQQAESRPETPATPATPPRPRFGWLRVVLGGLFAAVLLRACVIEAYRIPSNSMERTLLIGDFVLVSKLAYGARIAGWRAPGHTRVQCGDVMVFNHPPARGPIELRAPYIKRVVGLPGETVSIQRKQVVVDGVPLVRPPESLALYDLRVDESFSAQDSTLLGRVQRSGADRWIVSATPEQDLLDVPGVIRAIPFVVSTGEGATFPRARRWGADEYGPLTVPRAGWTIPLTPETMADYRVIVEEHEGRTVDRFADGFRLDGVAADSFTFTQDYYFVLGDNRDDSADSRAWGFVPMSHVIGRADWIYFSREIPETLPGMPPAEGGEIRWDRVGRRVARSCERGQAAMQETLY